AEASLDDRGAAAAVDPYTPDPITGPRQREVVRHRAGHDQTLALAVLGDQDDPGGAGLARRPRGDGPVIDDDPARSDRIHAAERAGQFGPARADQAGQAQHFAGPQLEANPVHMLVPQVLDRQDDRAEPPGWARRRGGDVATDHQPDQLVGI